MRTLFRNIAILTVAVSPFVSGCTDDGNEINYNIQPGNELYLPLSGKAVDLSRGADVEFQWAPSVAYDNGFVSYELLFDLEGGDFSAPLAAMTSQLNGSKTYLSVTSKKLNAVARAAGLGTSETGNLKWTVRASKGLFGSIYSESRLLSVTTTNAMNPFPRTVILRGDALEDPTGINMAASAGIDKAAASEGTFECFTKIKGSTGFTVEDDLGRYYVLNENKTVTYSETAVNNQMPSEAIYWLKIDFDMMTWSYNTVSKIEYYAAAWADNKMSTVNQAMTYAGKGVWTLLDYENTISNNSANDSRHRFNATLGDGTKLYLGTQASLGTSYTTDYLKVNLYTTETVNTTDKVNWEMTYKFLTADCGRKLDCYLYLNGDNPAGTWWHEYKFK
ncbi:SusE domain-containing protein [uncultured Alistipes sp.]|uniref:SusE domain-containing protein n=1 Tax=uncultured Alistipes sp. TaxID=538949 RepID=UPI0025903EA2|nr:SusE domain-containing protein [uncultured Alistipes sp.]